MRPDRRWPAGERRSAGCRSYEPDGCPRSGACRRLPARRHDAGSSCQDTRASSEYRGLLDLVHHVTFPSPEPDWPGQLFSPASGQVLHRPRLLARGVHIAHPPSAVSVGAAARRLDCSVGRGREAPPPWVGVWVRLRGAVDTTHSPRRKSIGCGNRHQPGGQRPPVPAHRSDHLPSGLLGTCRTAHQLRGAHCPAPCRPALTGQSEGRSHGLNPDQLLPGGESPCRGSRQGSPYRTAGRAI